VKYPLEIVEEMYREGLAMKREQFHRAIPSATEEELDAMIREWILDRPFDAPGRVRYL
jgi:hypothetical protein